MGNYNYPATSPVAPINTSNGFYNMGFDNQDDFMGAEYGQQDLGINTGINTGGSSLFGNIGNYLSGKDGASNLGGMLSGAAGLYGMYQSHQAGKDNAKNNSLYRKLMTEENTRKNKFYDGWSDVSFGGK